MPGPWSPWFFSNSICLLQRRAGIGKIVSNHVAVQALGWEASASEMLFTKANE